MTKDETRAAQPVCDSIEQMDASMRYPFEYFVSVLAKGDADTRATVRALEPGVRIALETLNERKS